MRITSGGSSGIWDIAVKISLAKNTELRSATPHTGCIRNMSIRNLT